ncbi:aspartate carbamoyltransferase regulatory subunit [Candidatus Woesearchaeota archaeon]|nr:aspartate carbamoyltransferase regulatory subunit [Candidatus Woesearchaeota archaeon]
MTAAKKEMKVPAIQKGTVIDHIPPHAAARVLDILDLGDELVTFGNNLSSRKMKKKGIIKVSDKMLRKDELDRIALVAPEATLCEIKDYKVIKKRKVQMPDVFAGMLRCFNPNCITRHQDMKTMFTLVQKDPVRLKCHYCESTFDKDQLELL